MPKITTGAAYGICILDSDYRPAYWLKTIHPDRCLSTTFSVNSAKAWKTEQGAISYLCKNSEDLPKFVVRSL